MSEPTIKLIVCPYLVGLPLKTNYQTIASTASLNVSEHVSEQRAELNARRIGESGRAKSDSDKSESSHYICT